MQLYKLTESYENIRSLMDDETMDLTLLTEALQQIETQIEVKCENAVIIMKGLDGEIDTFKAEEKRLSERRRTLENKRDWLKVYLQGEIEKIGLEKVKAGLFTVALQNNPPSLQISDESIIPARFTIIIPEQKQIDRNAVKEALKAGEVIEGAVLTQGKSLRIR